MSLSIRNPRSCDWASIREMIADERMRVLSEGPAIPEAALEENASGLVAERRGRIVGVCLVSAQDNRASCLGLAVAQDEDVESVACELIAEAQPWFIVRGVEPLKAKSVLLDIA